MTSIDQARQAVHDRFITNWGTRTAFTFENERFTEPQFDTPWARLTVRSTGGGQETLGGTGNRKYRRSLSVFVDVFTPVDEGMFAGADHAEFARDLFEGTSFSGLDFNDGVVRELGADGRWYHHQMESFGDFEEIK